MEARLPSNFIEWRPFLAIRSFAILNWPGILTFVIALSVLLLAMPKDFNWDYLSQDSGELITAATTLGIPHPPGYPTYILIGKVFSLLPLWSLAARFQALSAVALSICAALITSISLYQVKSDGTLTNNHTAIWGSIASGLALILFPIVSDQALNAEVYALNLAIVGCMVWAILTRRNPFLIGLFFGLSITTHLTSLFLLPMVLGLSPIRSWGRVFSGFLLGLTPFLLLPLLTLVNGSPIIWGDPSTLSGWLWLISGRLYHPNAWALPSQLWFNRIINWSGQFWLLILFLLSCLLIIKLKSPQLLTKKGLVWCLISGLLYISFAITYQPDDAQQLIMPAMFMVAVLGGLALPHIGRPAWLVSLVFLPGFLSSAQTISDIQIRPTAVPIIEDLPDKAIVVTPGDQTISAVWYFVYAERLRDDLIVIDDNLFQFDWYRSRLKYLHQELLHLEEDDLPGFLRQNQVLRPICFLSLATNNSVNCTG